MYIKSFVPSSALKHHFVAHTACDIIEERVSIANKNHELYLGLLYAMEDLAVFGYVTNTSIKFVIMAKASAVDTVIKDQDIKSIFRRIHSGYLQLVMNPFYDPTMDSILIKDKRFIRNLEIAVEPK